jgi:hypothetical protein
VLRAECNRQLTEIKAVVTDCTAALQYAPRNLKAFLRRGLAFEFLEKYEAAASDFKSAMVGRWRLTVSKPELKARLVSALETKM